jgi:peptide methionine sulfoxide reductase MsrB
MSDGVPCATDARAATGRRMRAVGSALLLVSIQLQGTHTQTQTQTRPVRQHFGGDLDTVFDAAKGSGKPSGACPPRPTWSECPLQPRMAGVAQERGLFSKICTPPLERSVHSVSGAEDPANRCHGVHTGEFTCGCCGHTLFRASDKCESGTGWPSFSDSIGICIQDAYMDGDHGEHAGVTAREAVCEHCGAHIGDWIVDDAGFDVGIYDLGDPNFQPQCYNKITGRAGRFCTDGICLVPPQPEGATLGYGEVRCHHTDAAPRCSALFSHHCI